MALCSHLYAMGGVFSTVFFSVLFSFTTESLSVLCYSLGVPLSEHTVIYLTSPLLVDTRVVSLIFSLQTSLNENLFIDVTLLPCNIHSRINSGFPATNSVVCAGVC